MNDHALLTAVLLRVWKPISIGSPSSFDKVNRNNCGRFVELYTVERARLFANGDTHACSCLYDASKLPWCNRDYCPLDRRLRGVPEPVWILQCELLVEPGIKSNQQTALFVTEASRSLIEIFSFALPAIIMDDTYRILSSHIVLQKMQCQGTSQATKQMRLPVTYKGKTN